MEAVHPMIASGAASTAECDVIHLFDLLRDPLLRYVTAIGVSPQEGEEIVQETFLALFRHLRGGKPSDNLRGWLFRVAHNLALRQRRFRPASAPPDVHDPTDPEPTPEQRLIDRQRRRHLLAVVRALPERERYCLHLRAEGLRYREIAGVLGISLGAVSLAYTRAMSRLTRADGGA